MHKPSSLNMNEEAGGKKGNQKAHNSSGNQLLKREGPGQQDPEGKAEDKGCQYGRKFCLLQGYTSFLFNYNVFNKEFSSGSHLYLSAAASRTAGAVLFDGAFISAAEALEGRGNCMHHESCSFGRRTLCRKRKK